MAQVWLLPAVMAVKVPSGAFVWPYVFLPQQTARPCSVRAHVWFCPAVMAVKVPSGAFAAPEKFRP